MKRLKDADLSYLPAPLAAFIRDIVPEDAFIEIVGVNSDDLKDACSGLPCEKTCPVGCPIDADRPAADATADKPTRSAVCAEPEDASYDRFKRYITPDGKRHADVPRPDEYVEDAEDSYVEMCHIVTVYKAGEGGFLTPVARHGFGSTPPTETQIKWCILTYKGDTATVAKEYGLGY